jgi:hypothetical protein
MLLVVNESSLDAQFKSNIPQYSAQKMEEIGVENIKVSGIDLSALIAPSFISSASAIRMPCENSRNSAQR